MKTALAIVLAFGLIASAQAIRSGPKFMGREVTIAAPGLEDEPGVFPKGPASVCVEGPPQRQCYTAPRDFGGSPAVEVVQFKKGAPVLFFSAASGGVSGWSIHFAVLRSGKGASLENLLPSADVSNQNQHAFWNEPGISDAQIFLTADAVWGSGEGHYDDHRYKIAVYVLKTLDR